MNTVLPVTIYADTTGQYSEEELWQMEQYPSGQMIDIPVPEDLLKQWWYDCLDFDREQVPVPEGGWPDVSDSDFYHWLRNEYTADDTQCLYDWLFDHVYHWHRL